MAAEFGEPSPTPYQPEDYLQPPSWLEPEWITPTELTDWLRLTVNHEADFLTRGLRDRISAESVNDDPLQASLALVRPSSLKIVRTHSITGKRQVRALFTCDDIQSESGDPIQFDLVVTDDTYATRIYAADDDQITVPTGHGESVYLTVSLGVPFGGYHYKLIAAVIAEEEIAQAHGRAGVFHSD